LAAPGPEPDFDFAGFRLAGFLATTRFADAGMVVRSWVGDRRADCGLPTYGAREAADQFTIAAGRAIAARLVVGRTDGTAIL
jgi:hypothetical protein